MIFNYYENPSQELKNLSIEERLDTFSESFREAEKVENMDLFQEKISDMQGKTYEPMTEEEQILIRDLWINSSKKDF